MDYLVSKRQLDVQEMANPKIWKTHALNVQYLNECLFVAEIFICVSATVITFPPSCLQSKVVILRKYAF